MRGSTLAESDKPDSADTTKAPRTIDRSLPQLDGLYREVVLDHFRRPRGQAKLAAPSVCTKGFNPTCGDQVTVGLDLADGKVRDVEVHGHGCSISVASGSMMADLIKGHSKEEIEGLVEAVKELMRGHAPAENVDLGDVEALSGVAKFPVRIKCALLAWTTLLDALKQVDAAKNPSATAAVPHARTARETQ